MSASIKAFRPTHHTFDFDVHYNLRLLFMPCLWNAAFLSTLEHLITLQHLMENSLFHMAGKEGQIDAVDGE